MNSEEHITRGGLSDKMGGYQQAPPESVWNGVTTALHGKRSGRRWFILLGAAAGLALAVTVGITLFSDTIPSEFATNDKEIPGKNIASNQEEPSVSESVDAEQDPVETNSRLEEKVITAMQEVVEEQQTGREQVAGKDGQQAAGEALTGRDQGAVNEEDKEQLAVVQTTTDQTETGNTDAGLTGEETGQDSTGDRANQESNVDDEQQKAENNKPDREQINEDSLVQILQGEVPDIKENEKVRSGHWQVGASMSPQISYRDVAALDAAQNIAVNNSESARMTYAGGVQLSYLPNDRLTIQTGIYYNKMGVNIGDYSSFKSGWFESSMDLVYAPAANRSESVVNISNSMGTVITAEDAQFVNNYSGTETLTDYHMLTPEEMTIADASVERFSQTFEYLEIPFNVRYTILDRTIDLQVMGGFSTNLLVNNSISAITAEETVPIGQVEDIRTFNYSGNAGLGVVYNVFEKLSLSFEPRFRYYLNSVNTDNLPVTRPYTFGFYTGVNYKF